MREETQPQSHKSEVGDFYPELLSCLTMMRERRRHFSQFYALVLDSIAASVPVFFSLPSPIPVRFDTDAATSKHGHGNAMNLGISSPGMYTTGRQATISSFVGSCFLGGSISEMI